jgi:hypothetical protein
MRYIFIPMNDYSEFVVQLKKIRDFDPLEPIFTCTDLSSNHCYSPNHSCASLAANDTNPMPDLVFRLSGLEFTIPPQGYMFEPYNTSPPCNLAITQLVTSQYIFGDIFFRSFVVMFNYTDNSM